MGVDDVLRYNTERTRELMRQELTIRLDEVEGEWHYTSLEKIFFENKVYKVLENDARTWEKQLKDVKAAMLRRGYPEAGREAGPQDIQVRYQGSHRQDTRHREERSRAALPSRAPDGVLHRLLPVPQGQVRREIPPPHQDNLFREHRGHQGRRLQRQALHQPLRGLHRHLGQEDRGGRVRERLLRHRRGDRLHQGWPLHPPQGDRQAVCGEGHHPRRSPTPSAR